MLFLTKYDMPSLGLDIVIVSAFARKANCLRFRSQYWPEMLSSNIAESQSNCLKSRLNSLLCQTFSQRILYLLSNKVTNKNLPNSPID